MFLYEIQVGDELGRSPYYIWTLKGWKKEDCGEASEFNAIVREGAFIILR